jgi:hypothetical protein
VRRIKAVAKPTERSGKRAKARGPWREALRRRKQRRDAVPLDGLQRDGWFAYLRGERNRGSPHHIGKARSFWKGWQAAHLADLNAAQPQGAEL